MSYIGAQPTTAAFVTDQFNGDGSTTVFTMSVAPANSASVIVAVSGVLQDPSTYAVSGTSLTFSGAPPTGTGNISARYLGLPASGVATTAYRTLTEFTATSGQTTFSVPSYTVGFINVYRNGVMLGTADFTATSGTTVVLAAGATSGDLVTTESFYVSGVSNAIPAVAGAVNTSYITDGAVTAVKMAASGAWAPAGTVIQVVNFQTGAVATGTTAIPIDDSIPQNTEGAEFMTLAITPTNTSNKLLIQVVMQLSTNADANIGIALFQDSTANALAAQAFRQDISTGFTLLCLTHYMTAGTTSSTTFKARGGAGSGTYTFNGTNGARVFGGVMSSSITITEIAG